jgi:hypothetical protein
MHIYIFFFMVVWLVEDGRAQLRRTVRGSPVAIKVLHVVDIHRTLFCFYLVFTHLIFYNDI